MNGPDPAPLQGAPFVGCTGSRDYFPMKVGARSGDLPFFTM